MELLKKDSMLLVIDSLLIISLDKNTLLEFARNLTENCKVGGYVIGLIMMVVKYLIC